MEDWFKELIKYVGKPIELKIEDKTGEDQAPPIRYELNKLEWTEEMEHLRFYMNPTQFVAIPIFNNKRTRFIATPLGCYFESHDEKAELVYRVLV